MIFDHEIGKRQIYVVESEKFTQKCLEEAGVAVIPGTAFGKFATHNVRLNFATSKENISKAIEKIDKILK